MAAWKQIPALVSLGAEIDQLAPTRDRSSDGSIGDLAHQKAGSSDHLPDEDTPALRNRDADKVNELHAADKDRDLNKPGWSMARIVQIIVLRHRSGADDRLQYVIFDGRIWSASWGWTARAYTGANKHDHHAHFSAKYGSKQESDTRPWGLLEADRASVSVPSSKGSTAAPGTRLVKQGMSGRDIAFLQRWVGAKDSGVFDAATKARVIRYQRIVGLVADGICGKATWSRILGRTIKL
jgi:putative peptidoglycan binding protein